MGLFKRMFRRNRRRNNRNKELAALKRKAQLPENKGQAYVDRLNNLKDRVHNYWQDIDKKYSQPEKKVKEEGSILGKAVEKMKPASKEMKKAVNKNVKPATNPDVTEEEIIGYEERPAPYKKRKPILTTKDKKEIILYSEKKGINNTFNPFIDEVAPLNKKAKKVWDTRVLK